MKWRGSGRKQSSPNSRRSWNLFERKEKCHRTPQSWQCISWPKFDSGTCQVQHNSATRSLTGVIWLKSVAEGGGAQTTTGINLRRSQVWKIGKVILNQFLIYHELRQRAQRIYSASHPLQPGDPGASILRPVKSRSFKKISDFPLPK